MGRTDVEFNAEGTILRGWLYLPDGAGERVPGVVMAHGLSAVKEMYLDAFAEVFAAAGLAALVFDNRNFGASDGEPRYEIDPWAQIRDYRHAITHMQNLPGIDRDRIGVWGSSYSGAHVIVLGAIDKRIKAVVSQVPLISGSENARRLIRSDFFGGLVAAVNDVLTVSDLAIDAYERAREPKKLVLLPGGHFDAYTGPDFDLSSSSARDWLVQHLTA